ncbi:MAG: hypothetical protein IPG04_40650 [Polyangiaceae bacterium]|nr:hypothetical protein [Polyangiaceae bacterium]
MAEPHAHIDGTSFQTSASGPVWHFWQFWDRLQEVVLRESFSPAKPTIL